MLLAIVASLVPQGPITVTLAPANPGDGGGPRWSPKGASVALTASEGALTGSFALGPKGSPVVAVRLAKSADAEHFDRLALDRDRDGKLADDEVVTTTPKEQRGKWWSSFTAVVAIPVPADGDKPATTRPYPLDLWFVVDPKEPEAKPEAKPALRWSRRGWNLGTCEIAGRPAFVTITEMEMDGVFDQRDAWALARSPAALAAVGARSMEQHCWLDGIAYRPTAIDPHGRSITFERVDPGITEEQEKAKADIYKPDREAPRAAKPLAFSTDLAAALATAKSSSKRVFVDFQTTWCGPCAQMDALVYPAAAVVTAAKDVLAVKLDGDEQRDLVKKYAVTGYPTLVLLDSDGKEVRRAVGYRGVAALVDFLKP